MGGSGVEGGCSAGSMCVGVLLERTSRRFGDWSQSVTFVTELQQQRRLFTLTARFSVT